jgi:hypothetical protein
MSRISTSIVLCCAMSSASLAQTIVCGSARRNAAATQARVLVLRPRVKFWKEKAFSRSESEGAVEGVQAGFHGVLSRTFEAKGYTLRFDPKMMAQWEETPPNDGAIKALQDDYDSLLSLVSTTAFPDCNRMLKTSLQEDLKKVTDLSEFDAVVLARAHGKAMTKTAKLTDWYGSNDLHFNIGVVDGSTGRLLYYCESTATGNYMSAPDSRLSGPVQNCLKQYFSGGPNHR